jgi:hypothetical protein
MMVSMECDMILAPDGTRSPPGTSRWLRAPRVYNLSWGIRAIARPHRLFNLGAERINYAEIWQCVGMTVGDYGVG